MTDKQTHKQTDRRTFQLKKVLAQRAEALKTNLKLLICSKDMVMLSGGLQTGGFFIVVKFHPGGNTTNEATPSSLDI